MQNMTAAVAAAHSHRWMLVVAPKPLLPVHNGARNDASTVTTPNRVADDDGYNA